MAKNELVKAFSGFVVYEQTAEGDLDLKRISEIENFEHFKYQVANENEICSIGYEPVIPLEITDDGEIVREEEYTHSVGKFDIIKIKQSKRKVPGSEVKKIVESKIKKALKEASDKGEEIKIDKDLKNFFKEEAVKELLPRCFVDEFSTFVFYDREVQLLYAVVPSYKKAEELTCFIRTSLGSLPIKSLSTEVDIVNAMTAFVTKQLRNKLTLGSDVQLENEEGVVAWKKESLYHSEAPELIEDSGKMVTKIGLNYDGVLSFIVDSKYVFSSLKFEEYVTSESSGLSSSFLLIANEITNMVKEFLKELGEE